MKLYEYRTKGALGKKTLAKRAELSKKTINKPIENKKDISNNEKLIKISVNFSFYNDAGTEYYSKFYKILKTAKEKAIKEYPEYATLFDIDNMNDDHDDGYSFTWLKILLPETIGKATYKELEQIDISNLYRKSTIDFDYIITNKTIEKSNEEKLSPGEKFCLEHYNKYIRLYSTLLNNLYNDHGGEWTVYTSWKAESIFEELLGYQRMKDFAYRYGYISKTSSGITEYDDYGFIDSLCCVKDLDRYIKVIEKYPEYFYLGEDGKEKLNIPNNDVAGYIKQWIKIRNKKLQESKQQLRFNRFVNKNVQINEKHLTDVQYIRLIDIFSSFNGKTKNDVLEYAENHIYDYKYYDNNHRLTLVCDGYTVKYNINDDETLTYVDVEEHNWDFSEPYG